MDYFFLYFLQTEMVALNALCKAFRRRDCLAANHSYHDIFGCIDVC